MYCKCLGLEEWKRGGGGMLLNYRWSEVRLLNLYITLIIDCWIHLVRISSIRLSDVRIGGLGFLDPFDQQGGLCIIYFRGGSAIHQFMEKLDADPVVFNVPDL